MKTTILIIALIWQAAYSLPIAFDYSAQIPGCKAEYDAPSCIQIDNEAPQPGVGWESSFDINLDYKIKNGRIVMYKINWANGVISPWIATGINDLNNNYLVKVGLTYQVRRFWYWFGSRVHSYVICK